MNKTPTQELIDSLIARYCIAHLTGLAERVKMRQPTLLRIYNGQVPKFRTIKPLLDHFGISYDRFLLGGSIDAEPHIAKPSAPYYDRETEKLLRAWGNLRPSTRKYFMLLMQNFASEISASGAAAGYIEKSAEYERGDVSESK